MHASSSTAAANSSDVVRERLRNTRDTTRVSVCERTGETDGPTLTKSERRHERGERVPPSSVTTTI